MKTNIFLEEMCWPDVKGYMQKNDTILIAVGSIEQHGPMLPLSCDVIVPHESLVHIFEKQSDSKRGKAS